MWFMKGFCHCNSQLSLCNKPPPKFSQLLPCMHVSVGRGLGWALPGYCAVGQLCLLLQVLGQLGSSASWASYLLGPVAGQGMLFTSSSRLRVGTGTLLLPKQVICRAVHCS